jgi:hypothetical protein
MRSESVLRCVLLALLLGLVGACGAADPPASSAGETSASPPPPPHGSRTRPFIGRGLITEIRGPVVQIDHETIPGFMAAVTMDFPMEDPSLLEGLYPGQAVVFSIMRDSQSHQIIAIEPAR